VLGTRFESPRALVNVLRACVAGLPEQQRRLVVMRYGVGAPSPRPDRAVAGALGLARSEYTALRGRALRGLVRDARSGGCGGGGAGVSSAVVRGGGSEAPAGAGTPVSGALGEARLAVRGERAFGRSEASGENGDAGFGTPLAIDAREPAGSLIGVLMLIGSLAGLAVLGMRALRERVRR
jgi:hypothetical protein